MASTLFFSHLSRCAPSALHSPDFEVLYNEVLLCGERLVVEGGTGKTGTMVQISIQPQAKAAPIQTKNKGTFELNLSY